MNKKKNLKEIVKQNIGITYVNHQISEMDKLIKLVNYLEETAALKYAIKFQKVRINNFFYNRELVGVSGHFKHYSENLYKIEHEDIFLKPMNCPNAFIFLNKNKPNKYPTQIHEIGTVFRKELKSNLNKKNRFSNFTIDDNHTLCKIEYSISIIELFIKKVCTFYKIIGIDQYNFMLSTKPDKSQGNDTIWEKSEQILKKALQINQMEYEINHGDGSFYAPKIDIRVEGIQLSTVQLDLFNADKFDLKNNNTDQVCIVHHALTGSIERLYSMNKDKLSFLIKEYTMIMIDCVKDKMNNKYRLAMEKVNLCFSNFLFNYKHIIVDFSTSVKMHQIVSNNRKKSSIIAFLDFENEEFVLHIRTEKSELIDKTFEMWGCNSFLTKEKKITLKNFIYAMLKIKKRIFDLF